MSDRDGESTTASRTSQFASATSVTAADSESESNHGSPDVRAIVGGVLGGVAAVVVVVVAILFIRRRRIRRRRAVLADTDPHEKAQLHFDDIKPGRKELSGGKGPRSMLDQQSMSVTYPPTRR